MARLIAHYLRQAGVEVKAIPGGVSVRGKPVRFSSVDRRVSYDEAVVDRVVGEAALDVLMVSAVRELGGQGLPFRALERDGAVRLYDGHHAVAVIRATRAKVSGHGRNIHGNFFAGGDHWDIVRRWLAMAVASTKPGRAAVQASGPGDVASALSRPSAVHTHFPDAPDAPDALRLAAINASRLLRHRRTVEFGHTVALHFEGGSLRFRPIPETGPTRAPFIYEGRAGTLTGAIRLNAPNDPMALEADGEPGLELLVQAWAAGLVGYAELTCVPGAEPSIPDQFRPTVKTRNFLASYVVGHLRHLPEGRSPSQEARAHAERIGVKLTPRQTWVRPHARGIPPDAELVFDWMSPHVLDAVP